MHKGNITPTEAHQRLQGNASAVLVDVRTQPEWTFVGVPAVERLVRLAWQVFPAMQVNAKFVEEIEQMGLPKDAEILCICRWRRSSSAASALTRRDTAIAMWRRVLRATRMPAATAAR